MRFLIPLALAVLILGGGGGLYALHSFLNSDDTKITLDGDNSGKSTFGAALRMMVEDASGATTTKADIDISGLLPEARPGWFRKDYENSQGEALTGREIIHSAVVKSTSNTMLLKFETDSKNRRGHHAYTYMRGDLRVIVRARILEQLNRDTVRGGMLGTVSDNMAAATVGLEPEGPDRRFATMDGVAFTQEAPFNYVRLERRSVPTDYRVFNADINGHVHIQIMTNASDNAVAETIKMLDIATILDQLGRPATVAGFDTHLPQPLSQERPPQTPAQAAFALLQGDHRLAENEIRTVRKISSGEIETAEQLKAKVGSGQNLSPAFQAFLAAQTFPPQMTVDTSGERQQDAADLIKYIPKASPSEFVLLHMIRTGQVTTAQEAARFFPHLDAMSSATKSLLDGYQAGLGNQYASADNTIVDAASPGTSDVVVTGTDRPLIAGGETTKPTVRRGTGTTGFSGVGSCAMDAGARRCTVTSN